MSTTIQQLFHKWATLAPDECLSTEWDYKFKLRILPNVEKSNSLTDNRQIITENLETHKAYRRDFTIRLLNFVLLRIIYHCAARQSSISFSFTELGTIATRKQRTAFTAISAPGTCSVGCLRSIAGVLEGGT